MKFKANYLYAVLISYVLEIFFPSNTLGAEITLAWGNISVLKNNDIGFSYMLYIFFLSFFFFMSKTINQTGS